MKNTGTLKVTTPSPTEIVLTRVFDAPRDLVFRAMHEPELVKRWYGPHGHNLVVCEIDFRVGGKWRYVLRDPGGKDMGMYGSYKEIDAPARIVSTEGFDMYPVGEALVTVLLVEHDGKTTMTSTSRYPSQQIRDMVIATGMEHGAAETFDRLNDLLRAGS